MKEPTFIGLDLSLTRTGMCAITGTAIEFYTLSPKPAGIYGAPRLDWLIKEIDAVATQHGNIHAVAIEGYSFNSQNQAHKMGELGGLVRWWFYKLRIPTLLVSPKTMQKFVTGRGDNPNPKEVVRECIRETWGVFTNNEDESDAGGCAMVAQAWRTRPDDLEKYQIDALKKIEVLPMRAPRQRRRRR